jgi:DNA-binding transcriptional MerR regulator
VTTYLTIGEFSQRTRLSPKALRLYGELGLLLPARVDPDSGYRFYREDQIEPARLVGLLRRLDMPLATIGELLELDGAEAAQALATWWEGVEAVRSERRGLVAYLQARLRGEEYTVYDIDVRRLPERTLISINRHVDASGTDAFFNEAFARLRAAGRGLQGIAGVPFLVFYGEVSEDSDGPIELCRPVGGTATAREPGSDLGRRVEAAHDEAYIRLTLKEMGWPALLPACEALERWTKENGREPAGAIRQLLIADQRTATPDTPVCDLSIPLR